MDLKGKSINDLMNMDANDFLSLNRSEASKVVSRLASAANKRLRSMGQTPTPATKRAAKSGGAFSVKGKTLNQIRSEYVRAKQFLQNETSTKKGYDKFVKSGVSQLAKMGVTISEKNYKRFTDLFDELKDIDPTAGNRNMRYKIMPEMAKMVESGELSDSEILERMEQRVVELYEEQEQQSGVSDFFNL